jgi:hypothetical protein
MAICWQKCDMNNNVTGKKTKQERTAGQRLLMVCTCCKALRRKEAKDLFNPIRCRHMYKCQERACVLHACLLCVRGVCRGEEG